MSSLEFETSATLGSRVELYLFETEDGRNKFAYTTDREPKVFASTTFIPESISRGELRQQVGDANAEKLEIKVPYNNPVAAMHVPYLPPRPVKITIYSYQRNDPANEIVQGFVGYVTNFTQRGAEVSFECSQIIDALNQMVPWVTFKGDCVWALYNVGCFVDKALWLTEVPSVIEVVGEKITAAAFSAKPDGWFTNGYAVNPATGEQRFISKHDASTGTIYLVYPFLGYGGGPLQVFAGCDRRKETCSGKFNNKERYLGFDHSPAYNVFQKGIR